MIVVDNASRPGIPSLLSSHSEIGSIMLTVSYAPAQRAVNLCVNTFVFEYEISAEGRMLRRARTIL